MAESPLKHLDQLLHTVERGRALNVDNEGRLPVRLYGPDGQPLFTEQNPAHVKGEVTLTGQIVQMLAEYVDIPYDYLGGLVAGSPTGVLAFGQNITIRGTTVTALDVSSHPHVDVYVRNDTDVDLTYSVRGSLYSSESDSPMKRQEIHGGTVGTGKDVWERAIITPALNRLKYVYVVIGRVDGVAPTDGELTVLISGSRI